MPKKRFCFSVHDAGYSFSGFVQGIWISRTIPLSISLIRTKVKRITVELQKHYIFSTCFDGYSHPLGRSSK